jgi:large subunit ribosomal protein L5
MPNLKEKYTNELRAPLQEKLGIQNVMALPKLTKVVINMGVGEAANDKKYLESAVQNLTAISGQKPVITKQENQLLVSKLERVGQLDARLLCVVTRCTNLWKD